MKRTIVIAIAFAALLAPQVGCAMEQSEEKKHLDIFNLAVERLGPTDCSALNPLFQETYKNNIAKIEKDLKFFNQQNKSNALIFIAQCLNKYLEELLKQDYDKPEQQQQGDKQKKQEPVIVVKKIDNNEKINQIIQKTKDDLYKNESVATIEKDLKFFEDYFPATSNNAKKYKKTTIKILEEALSTAHKPLTDATTKENNLENTMIGWLASIEKDSSFQIPANLDLNIYQDIQTRLLDSDFCKKLYKTPGQIDQLKNKIKEATTTIKRNDQILQKHKSDNENAALLEIVKGNARRIIEELSEDTQKPALLAKNKVDGSVDYSAFKHMLGGAYWTWNKEQQTWNNPVGKGAVNTFFPKDEELATATLLKNINLDNVIKNISLHNISDGGTDQKPVRILSIQMSVKDGHQNAPSLEKCWDAKKKATFNATSVVLWIANPETKKESNLMTLFPV